MDIIVLILIVLFAVMVIIVAGVIINKRKRRHELKKEEEKVQKEQEKRRQEEEQKRLKEESLRKEDERLERIKDEEKNVEQEVREKASNEKVEGERLEPDEKESETEQEAKVRKTEEEKTRKEESQKKEELERRPEQKEKQELPPGERGGRPRGPTQPSPMRSLQEPKLRALKPEIICWNEGWEWIVGIEIPEEFASPRVAQNDELLEQDTADAAIYYLRNFENIVRVDWTAGEQDRKIDIPIMETGRNYLIFKMRKDWKGLGRLVRRPTAGYYLIIAPQEWKLDEETSGPAPVEPENVQINGYKAHFFVLRQNEDTVVAFIDAKDERIKVDLESSRFHLVGREISDSSEDMGPLFGEEPPRIKTINERGWSSVGVVVVGEEGSGRNRWRTQFVPQEDAEEQRMPDELTNRQGGWYFVRIYDKENDLLESMDFRFIAGLKDIQIMNSECLPEPDGYNDVIVQLIHQANCKVEPAGGEMYHALKIRQENNLTIVTIPPRPNYDKTHWILSNESATTKVAVLVERVWWCVDRLGVVPESWKDKTVSLSREDFTATTDKALWMKFPRKRWISKIEVGFNHTKSRGYSVEVKKEEIAVPLRDFCDAEEIENKQEESTMKIWVSHDGIKTFEAIVLKIPPELPLRLELPPPSPPPKVEPAVKVIPKAEVKSSHRKRKGKGFSRDEINNAGLTIEDVKRLHIHYDKRRKSSHLWNIEKLKYITM